MGRLLRRAAVAIAIAVPRRRLQHPPAEARPAPAEPKLGVVGLVSEVKHRGMTEDNWRDSSARSSRTNRQERLRASSYEVTVLYDDGTTGTVTVDEKPGYQAGQKIRVTGNQIEPVTR